MSDTPTRMPLTSKDMTADRLDELRKLLPEVFAEGRVDFTKLKLVLGEAIDERRERYGLTWSGKAEATRAIQVPSTGTLRPVREESVAFDETENVLIEGDNLEVLKLLQKSYHGRVKMIYIDPPYNTGKEFIYPDNFREGLHDYLRYSGQVDDDGQKLTSATETSGRYHSKWLSMMYPRLFLARNLLRDDGVIFVSIDDNEVHNLRHLMDEVFGPENWLAALVWNKGHSQQQGIFKEYHEYVLAYARDKSKVKAFSSTSSDDVVGGALKKVSKANPESEFTFPPGVRCSAPDGTEFRGTFGGAEKVRVVRGRFLVRDGRTVQEVTLAAGWTQLNQMRAFYYGNGEPVLDTRGQEVLEFFFNSAGKLKYRKRRRVETPATVQRWGKQSAATDYLTSLLGGVAPFERPKPVGMLQDLAAWVCSEENDLVLDFFAGSGSTGEAVMQLNAHDGGNRRFILVQLPEPTNRDDYPTIADITKARLKAASKAVREKLDGKLDFQKSGKPDLGFRTFKLTASNFKIWEPPAGGPEAIAEQLTLYADNLKPGAPREAILYELMLKAGLPLTSPIEKRELAGAEVYSIADGMLFICLADPINVEVLRAMMAEKPQMVICLDHAFRGNDTLLTNTVLEMKSHGIEHFRTV